MVTTAALTAEEFYRRFDEEPYRHDLVEGEVWTMAAADAEHGIVAHTVLPGFSCRVIDLFPWVRE